MSYLTYYEEINGRYVAFGGNPKGGKITGKVNTAFAVTTAGTQVNAANSINIDNLSDAIICSFLSDQAKEGPNYALMAYSTSISDSESLNKLIDSQIVNNCKKDLGYNAVLPPHVSFFMPPKPDLSYTGLEEFTSEPAVGTLNAKTSKEVPKVSSINWSSSITITAAFEKICLAALTDFMPDFINTALRTMFVLGQGNLIKRVYMLSLRERMELDLEARLMGETLVLNRSLDHFFKDYIKLNDLNEPFELRRNQGDDLIPTIEEGEIDDLKNFLNVFVRIFMIRTTEGFEYKLKSGDLNPLRLSVLKCLLDDQNSRSGSLKELRTNTFNGSDHEDANEYIEKVLEIIDLFHIPNITIDQVMLRAFLMSLTGAASRWLRNKPTVEGVKTMMPITSAEDKAQRRLEVKARSTVMMGIPNEHQLKFNSIKDTKSLLEAIEKSNEAVNTAFAVTTAGTQVNDANSINIDNLSDAIICSFLVSQSNSSKLVNEDLEQIHPDDLEEMGLKWQMATLTMRAKRFLKNTEGSSILMGIRLLPLIKPWWNVTISIRGATLHENVEHQEHKTTRT
nr:hypothetical protein [Tanacetum cinerariifolium]